jgi:hypothetical protein
VTERDPRPGPDAPLSAPARRDAVAAWRALPTHVRRQAVTSARAGEAPPDPVAAELGRRYAVAMLAPRGPSWWARHRWDAAWTPLLVGLAALLVVGAFWAHSTGAPWGQLWGALLLAVVLLLYAGTQHGLARTLRALAAQRPPATPPDGPAPPVSGGRPPTA